MTDQLLEPQGGFDPMTQDWFSPPSHHVDAPSPHRAPRPIPEADRLFAVQRALVKAINLMTGLGGKKDTPGQHDSLDKAVSDAYRGLNRYLRDYSAASPGSGTIE